MKRLTLVSVSVVVGLSLVLAGAAHAAAAAKRKAAGPACARICEATTGAATIMGPVKGAVSGKMFVVMPSGGNTVTVDASKATVLHNGKYAALSTIKAGTVAKVKGTIERKKMMASEVCICDKVPIKR